MHVNTWRDVAEAVQRCKWSWSPEAGPKHLSFRRAVESELRRRGWELAIAVPLDAPDGPRLDLVAFKGGERVAVEFDRASPRQSSLDKLRAVNGCARVVALREGFTRLELPRGLDAVVTFWPPRLYCAEQPRGYTPRPKKQGKR